MKKTIIILILVAVMISIIIAVLSWLRPKTTTIFPKPNIVSFNAPQAPMPLDDSQLKNAQIKRDEVKKRHPHLIIDQQALEQASVRQQLFNEVALEKIQSRLPIDFSQSALNDGRLFSEYDPLVIETKGIGEQIQWQALEYGINHIGVIQNIEDLGDNVYRWTGYFKGKDPAHHHFRITQVLDEQYAIAKINTEYGSFEFESKNGIGWLRPSVVKDTDIHGEDIHQHE